MSCKVESYNVAQHPELGLSVIQCGLTACNPLHRHGPVNYKNYVLHFNLKGKCVYTIGNVSKELSEGEAYLIFPGQTSSYIADELNPCEFIYVIFEGKNAESILKSAQLDSENNFFRFDLGSSFVKTIYKMHSASKNIEGRGYDVIGHLMIILSRLISQTEDSKQAPSNIYLAKAREYIEYHYPYKLSASDVAAYVGLERSYIYRLFVNEYGISPHQFIIDFRIKKATELIEEDSLTLSEIALSTGFCDFSNFSKNFIKRHGISPGEYRKKVKS